MEKLTNIEKAREKRPNDELLKLAMAHFYDDYAYTGLLEKERELLNQEKAIATYKSYLQHDPDSEESYIAIGRLLFRGKKWQEAANWFSQGLQRGITNPSIILWYLECLFYLGDFETLRSTARNHIETIKNNETIPTELQDAVALWASR